MNLFEDLGRTVGAGVQQHHTEMNQLRSMFNLNQMTTDFRHGLNQTEGGRQLGDVIFGPPSWGDRIKNGLKKVGLVAAVIVCGALAIGLLPLTAIGVLLMAKDQHGQGATFAVGMVLAAPYLGCILSVDALKK